MAPLLALFLASWPIARMVVEGNHNYSQEQILKVAGLKVGQMAGEAEFDAARDRLLATGAFESVGYRFEEAKTAKGYVASFQVVEVAPVFPARFEDLGVPADQIAAYLERTEPLYSQKIAGTPAMLDHYAQAIQKFLESKGQKTKVAGRLTQDAPNEVVALFRPAVALSNIARVSFEGNKIITSSDLEDAIISSAVGLPYTENRFRQTLDAAIRPLYEARGRLRVSFPKIEVEPARDVTGLIVNVTISEGVSYDLGDVKLDAAGLAVADLLKAGNFKTGEPANFKHIGEGVDRIKKKLGSAGYMHPSAEVERKIDDQAKKVDLVIHITPGQQYLFGKLKVEGLDLDGEAAIRRMWVLKEGTPFKVDYPDYFLERIKEGGVFDNLKKTHAVVKADEATHKVDVTLVFSGGPSDVPRSNGQRRRY